jgi:MinD superfamily P-loop ATPase
MNREEKIRLALVRRTSESVAYWQAKRDDLRAELEETEQCLSVDLPRSKCEHQRIRMADGDPYSQQEWACEDCGASIVV